MTRWTVILAVFMMVAPAAVHGQEWEILRYSDADGDGRNDLFRDADGDGRNDVGGKKYRHRFTFRDADGDRINDLFRDADGDGVNDLGDASRSANVPKSFVFVLDYDDDGLNDVTGEKYIRALTVKSFVDENGDGIDDRETWAPVKSLMGKLTGENDSGRKVVLENVDGPTMDRFIDENRDGINDGRNINDKMTTESLNNKP